MVPLSALNFVTKAPVRANVGPVIFHLDRFMMQCYLCSMTKNRLWAVLLGACFCFSPRAFTLENTVSVAAPSSSAELTAPVPHLPSRWAVEGSIQAHSVAGTASPWVGLAGTFRINPALHVGLRGFLPVATTVDNSSYEIQAFLRFRVSHGENTDFFIEPDFAENFYRFIPFTSYGIAFGALNRLRPDLSVGIMGGVEFARVVLDSYGLENRSDLIVYPKIALLADFNF